MGDKPTRSDAEPKAEGNAAAAPLSPPIVGVGASAGGLEAFSELLKHLQSPLGVAIAFVQHLEPTHESELVDILSRRSPVPVIQVTDGLVVEADNVYVIPPNVLMHMDGPSLRLTPRPAVSAPSMTIDMFFESLAATHGSGAIGVVLSGTGTDGTLGLAAIKAQGGITLAQDPGTASHSGMPDSAIGTGAADIVASPQGIAEEIARLSHHPYVQTPSTGDSESAPDLESDDEKALEHIIERVRESTGLDLKHYKRPTLIRRIERRMVMSRAGSMAEYLPMLAQEPDELGRLFEDVLVRVTSFFRDPEVFEALKSQAFPLLLAQHESDADPIRVWVPGCATGQEPYSIAILLAEYLESAGLNRSFQVFASDLREDDLAFARRGVYPPQIESEMSAERLERFFTSVDGGGYRISKPIREACVFARHDVTSDPPFARLDLVSCRNLLIYLDTELQGDLLRIFHYALRPGGYLVLGTAEGIAAAPDLFERSPSAGILLRGSAETSSLAFARVGRGRSKVIDRIVTPDVLQVERDSEWSDAQRQLDDMLLDRYSPAAVLIDDRMRITQIRGAAGEFLQMRPGTATLELSSMVAPGFAAEIHAAVDDARTTQKPARRNAVMAKPEGGHASVEIVVLPIRSAGQPLSYAVLFNEGGTISRADGEPGQEPTETEYLRQELEAAEERLRIIRYSRDTAMEELRAANEEIQSSNEELQSMNEELETAKEELQSTNEELTTLNAELQSRNSDLSDHVDDLDNLLSSASIPIVMLDSELRVRRYTDQATHLFALIPADIGRPLTDISSRLAEEDLDAKLRSVVSSGRPHHEDVVDDRGHWHHLSIRPFRTGGGRIGGAVVTLMDIDAQTRIKIESERVAKFRETAINVSAVLGTAEDIDVAMGEALHLIAEALKANDYRIDTEDGVIGPDQGESGRQPVEERSAPDRVIGLTLPVFSASGRRIRTIKLGFNEDRAPLDGPELDFGTRVAEIVGRAVERASQMETLELLVKERTASLELTLLHLETALHARDEFLARISHELRTPLNSIIGFSHLLLNGASGQLNEEQRAHVEIVLGAGNHLLAIIVDMLDMEKIVAGAMPLAVSQFRLRTLMEEASQMLRPLAEAKGLDLRIAPMEEDVVLNSDELKVRQILLNLLSNAVKFTDSGHITVGATADTEVCTLFVEDTGHGMTPAQLEQAFEEFAQVDRGPDDLSSGTGLGLSIAKRLTRLLGGELTASSTPGVGTVFTVTLACALPGARPDGAHAEA